MITETTINLYPIIKYIGIFCVIGIGLFLIHNLGGLKIFSKHDNSIIRQFLDKFPLVSPEFMVKSPKAQNIENNQEIHELNKRVEALEAYVQEINTNIQKQLDTLLEEIRSRG